MQNLYIATVIVRHLNNIMQHCTGNERGKLLASPGILFLKVTAV